MDVFKSIHGFFCEKIFGLFIMNIVLIGYRCSGKSAVGRILAKDLGLRLVDTDRVLEEKIACTIDQYVSENGWKPFRMVEKMVVRSVSGQDNQVIATGGGVILDRENVHYLRESGWVIWLQASLSTLHERMKRDEESGRVRPGLAGASPLAEIEAILAQRTPLYDRASDDVVNTDQKSPRTISKEIIKRMPAASVLLQKRVQSGEMFFASVLNP
ncbi:shikimate kinase [delta proteobacterium NaphS2]|nr:shikimate kinase [delta proteobacterium NaphS2]